MKEVKQTKKSASKNNNKSSVKNTSQKPKVKDTKVVIKEVEEIEENFLDDEDDNRLIIFIAIAILVIVATVICLIVGCEKKEINEPEKPQDDVIVPIKVDDGEDNEPKETKVTVKKTTVKNTTEVDEEEGELITHKVQFLLSNTLKTHSVKVVDGGRVDKYLPDGFSSCKYYVDDGLTQEFNFNSKIQESLNIYMSCELIVYNIVYDMESLNPTTYSVLDGEVLLENAMIDDIFDGWYTNDEFTDRVYSLNPSIIKYANDNVIKLYGNTKEKIELTYSNIDGEVVIFDEIISEDARNIIIFETNSNSICNYTSEALGWSKTQNSNQIDYFGGEEIILDDDLHLYPVCGKAKIVYYNEDDVVSIGVSEDKIEDLELPSDPVEDLGMKSPTYFIKSDVKKDNTKEIVDDSELEVSENQIKLSDVINNAGSSYENPNIGDNVIEKEKVFDGWKQIEKSKVIDPETGEEVEISTVIDEDVESTEVIEQISPSDESVLGKNKIELEAKWLEQAEDIVEDNKSSDDIIKESEEIHNIENIETSM